MSQSRVSEAYKKKKKKRRKKIGKKRLIKEVLLGEKICDRMIRQLIYETKPSF